MKDQPGTGLWQITPPGWRPAPGPAWSPACAAAAVVEAFRRNAMSWHLQASGHVAADDQSHNAEHALAEAFAAWCAEHHVGDWSFEGTHVRGSAGFGVIRRPAEPSVHRAGEHPADG